MIYDYFRVTGAHDTVLEYADFFSVTLRDDNIQEFDTRWDEVLLSMSKKFHQMKSWKDCTNREYVSLINSKTVLELYEKEIHQKISVPNCQKLKTMVKRSFDQKLRARNFDARHGKIESGAVIKSREGLSGVEGGKGTCYQWKEKRPVWVLQFPPRNPRSCTKTRTHCRHTFWANRITRSTCVEEEKYPRQR